jgi:hypothetical protein
MSGTSLGTRCDVMFELERVFETSNVAARTLHATGEFTQGYTKFTSATDGGRGAVSLSQGLLRQYLTKEFNGARISGFTQGANRLFPHCLIWMRPGYLDK